MVDVQDTNILCELDEESVLPTYLEAIKHLPASDRGHKNRWSAPISRLGMRAPNDAHLRLKVRLADFGEAQQSSGDSLELIQPNIYRAPEVILRAGWGPKTDIWNLACVVSG